jgi:hypothetical protein
MATFSRDFYVERNRRIARSLRVKRDIVAGHRESPTETLRTSAVTGFQIVKAGYESVPWLHTP